MSRLLVVDDFVVIVDIGDHTKRRVSTLFDHARASFGRTKSRDKVDEIHDGFVRERDDYERREDGEWHGAEHLVGDVERQASIGLVERRVGLVDDAVAFAVQIDVLDEIDP